jgi:hypothetical protein
MGADETRMGMLKKDEEEKECKKKCGRTWFHKFSLDFHNAC